MTQVTMRKRQAAGPSAGRGKTCKAQDRAVELAVSRKTYYRYIEQGMPKYGSLQEQRAWIAIAKNRQTPEPAPAANKPEAPAAGQVAEPGDNGRTVRTWADAERRARIAVAEQKTAKGRQRIIDEERAAITAETYELLAGLKAEIEGLCPECRVRIEAMLETTVRKMKERGECANG